MQSKKEIDILRSKPIDVDILCPFCFEILRNGQEQYNINYKHSCSDLNYVYNYYINQSRILTTQTYPNIYSLHNLNEHIKYMMHVNQSRPNYYCFNLYKDNKIFHSVNLNLKKLNNISAKEFILNELLFQ